MQATRNSRFRRQIRETELLVQLELDSETVRYLPVRGETQSKLMEHVFQQYDDPHIAIFAAIFNFFRQNANETADSFQVALSQSRVEQFLDQFQIGEKLKIANDIFERANEFVTTPTINDAYELVDALCNCFDELLMLAQVETEFVALARGEISEEIVEANNTMSYKQLALLDSRTTILTMDLKLLTLLNKCQSRYIATVEFFTQYVETLEPAHINEIISDCDIEWLSGNSTEFLVALRGDGTYRRINQAIERYYLIPTSDDITHQLLSSMHLDKNRLLQLFTRFCYVKDRFTYININEECIQYLIENNISDEKDPDTLVLILENKFLDLLAMEIESDDYVVLPDSELSDVTIKFIADLEYGNLQLLNPNTLFFKPTVELALLVNKCSTNLDNFCKYIEMYLE